MWINSSALQCSNGNVVKEDARAPLHVVTPVEPRVQWTNVEKPGGSVIIQLSGTVLQRKYHDASIVKTNAIITTVLLGSQVVC